MITTDNVLISNQDVHVICTILTVYVGLSVIEFPIPVTLISMLEPSTNCITYLVQSTKSIEVISCKYVQAQIICIYQMQVCATTNHFLIRCKYHLYPSDANMFHHKSDASAITDRPPSLSPLFLFIVYPFPLPYLSFSPFLDLLPQDVATQFPQVLANYYYCVLLLLGEKNSQSY